jgi:hypothetical protein
MARRPKRVGLESAADLARKIAILEREMAQQRAALDRLKQMGNGRESRSGHEPGHAKSTA